MQIVDVHLLIDSAEAVLVADAVDQPAANAAPCHPGAKTVGVVSPAIAFGPVFSFGEILKVRSASKLARPDQPAYRRKAHAPFRSVIRPAMGLVDSVTAFGQAGPDLTVMIPSVVGYLNEPAHPASAKRLASKH